MTDDAPPPIRRLDPPPPRSRHGAWHDMTADELDRVYRSAYWATEGDHSIRHDAALRSVASHAILRADASF